MGGGTICAKLNCTPLARSMIEPFVNNSLPARSSKSLKLETLDIDSRLTGLRNCGQGGHMHPLVCWQETLETHWKTRYEHSIVPLF